ncbi:uncharacterized protein B0I36DRAFT_87090 [Microdochium trichocladiopsis]|uniref:BZIP domain-containing protein n=1 Tax=Microdochium trichocladiopsis TaxID=1682393 RepID=A0A9P8YB46_9PEZI|nr:uncharacterized protein B0I36DRAFT_87090 [Microdochium trichocladiopsis]KAH7035032.1 hypothetical protein B0I36DRAFT_87090 [Microdochium trichocladiopsis]
MDKQSSSSKSQKAPKPRNSELRKEQNRIASRAYREKRKQKLALLDEILRTESRDSSSPSLPDDSEDFISSLAPPQTRHSSYSPTPSISHASIESNAPDHAPAQWQYRDYDQDVYQSPEWHPATSLATAPPTPRHDLLTPGMSGSPYLASSDHYYTVPGSEHSSLSTDSSYPAPLGMGDQAVVDLGYLEHPTPFRDDYSYGQRFHATGHGHVVPTVPESFIRQDGSHNQQMLATHRRNRSSSSPAHDEHNFAYPYGTLYPV